MLSCESKGFMIPALSLRFGRDAAGLPLAQPCQEPDAGFHGVADARVRAESGRQFVKSLPRSLARRFRSQRRRPRGPRSESSHSFGDVCR